MDEIGVDDPYFEIGIELGPGGAAGVMGGNALFGDMLDDVGRARRP